MNIDPWTFQDLPLYKQLDILNYDEVATADETELQTNLLIPKGK